MGNKITDESKHRPARLVDVAREACVSRTTVAKVLLNTGGPNTRASAEVAERIRDVAARLNFRPDPIARKLKGAKSMCLGVLVGYGRANNMLYRLLDIEEMAFDRGYRVQFASAHGNVERATAHMEDFEQQRFDGVIGLHLPASFGEAFFSRFSQGRPTVFQGMFKVPGACNVMLDRAAGIERAVSHLVACNRRRIGMIISGGNEDASVAAKIEGFNRGLQLHGRSGDPRWIISRLDMFDLQNADVVQDIVKLELDAVVCASDSVAIPLLRLLRRAGRRIPEDVAVTGFDNTAHGAWLDPSLTSIDQCDRLVAQTTVDRLIEMIESGRPVDPVKDMIWIEPELVIRESTGAGVGSTPQAMAPEQGPSAPSTDGR